MKLRDYQEDIINQTISSDKNTLIQVPTGGGKTVIARFITQKLSFFQNKRILFVAPKIILMEQTEEVFKGLNPKLVYGQEEYTNRDKVLLSTIQTANRRYDISPDVIIVDEIHYGYEGTMLKRLKENHPHARIIGLSATPYDSRGALLKGFDLILDKYDMKYMINNKYLVDLKSYILTKKELINDLEKIKITRGDYDITQLHDVMCKNNTIAEIVETTKEYIKKTKKTIVFAVDINHAELLTKAYNEKGFKARALHSKIEKDDNEAIEIKDEIKKFKRGETKILVSVLMLTTGFDVPDTDCAIIARPTRSQNLYKQMVGRVLRIAENKTHAILLDCGNVIKNLGMPLDPIREIEGQEILNKHKCKNCKSENLKLIKKTDGLYWSCQDCSEDKKVEEGGYLCDGCSSVHTHNSKFIIMDDEVFLACECGSKTLISTYDGTGLFIEVFDLEEWIEKYKISDVVDTKNISNILKLNVRNKKITFVPKELGNFTNLKSLDTGYNKLKQLPKEIGKLIRLEYLNLDSTNMISLPREIIKLKRLKKISLKYNSRLVLTNEQEMWLINLIEEKGCNVDLNQKKYSFIKEKNKKNSFYHWLSELDSELFSFKEFQQTTSLVLSNYNLKSIPKEIESLFRLKELVLDNNNLMRLPIEIGHLCNLEKISLANNEFKTLPYAILTLSKLNFLNINSNQNLTLKSNDIDYLSKLEENGCKILMDDALYVKHFKKEKHIKEIKLEIKEKEIEFQEKKEIKKTKLELKNKYLPFSKARKFVHKLKLKSIKEWKEYCKESIPSNIPKNPKEVYKGKGWVSILDWIGLV